MSNSKINNNQNIYLNNFIELKYNDIDFIWNNLNTSDDMILKKMNDLILKNTYMTKLNLIYFLLNCNNQIPFKNYKDIIKLFNFISPLNNEFNLGSFNWNFKIIKNKFLNKLFIQNSISKKDSEIFFYLKFINPLKKIFIKSNVKFNYFEFKNKRFNKTKDIIFVFDLF